MTRLLNPILKTLAAGSMLAATAFAVPAFALDDQQKKEMGEFIREYLIQNPEVMIEVQNALEAKQQNQRVDQSTKAVAANKEAIFASPTDITLGNPKGDVTVVAFMDYACGYCRATLPTIARLVKEDPGLRVVYHELPIIAEGSAPAARVSLYAAEAGRFTAFHQAMYAEEGVDNAKIIDAARKAGLDPAKVKAEIANAEGRNPAFAQSIRLARALEAEGTPLLVVGNQIFYGAVNYDTLKQAIAKARGKDAA